ncbi:uncharacterized protein LOC132750828 isoform X4 [Ruditapes philippinarum]|uniref:uncharacterized protein LOC132750828 isoform X4 n=1 Tax=Ruditapes philippinarum TaxID=129788 RepID=UPI00295BC6DF|nr:uncharacterized protein LOC132750828 isoform X4 [Ruditapes philippinarum]
MGAGASSGGGTVVQSRPRTSPATGKSVMNGTSSQSAPPKSAGSRTTQPGDPPNYHRSQIPPPRPPRTLKKDIFTIERYKEVDDYVLNAPPKLLVGNFNELIKYLARSNDRWDDMCKVRAIFLWVTSIDVYNLKVDGVPPTHSPLEYFTKIQCNMGNHAHLISGLCQMAGIPCVIISGMNKSAAYEIGSRCDRKSMGAQWNAVYVNDDWRFLDAFWASACVVGRKSGEWTLVDSDGNVTQEDEESSEGTTQHRINEFYFLPDPDKLVWTHFPDEMQWQLLDSPATLKEYEEHVYIRERFHYLGMKLMPNSHDKCMLTSKDGEIELVFSLPVKQSENSRFKYMLYQGQKAKTQEEDILLDRFVMFEHTANLLRFTLRFPITGKFKMDIFGLDITESDIFDLACTYVIQCNEAKKNCLPLPDVPPIGWGPGANAKEAGLKPITHDGAIIVTQDGSVEIRLAAEKNIQLHQMLKHALIDEATLSNYAVTRLENGEAVVNIRLPQGGEYALKLYADDAGKEGVAPNVLNYLIKSEGKNVNNLPFPNVSDGSLGQKPAAEALGAKALSHKGGRLTAINGRLRLEFQARSGLQMMTELHSSDELACKRMLVSSKEENGKWVFDLDMPEVGEYSLNVFACSKNSSDRIYNIHSYLVDSEGRKLDANELDTRQQNKHVQTHVPIETVQTSDNEVLIPIPPGFDDVCASLHRRNANDPPNAHQVDIIEQDGIQLIRARLPEFGEYQMNLYDREKKTILRNIAKYQINRRPPGELYEDNTKMLMQNLGAQQPIMEEEEEDFTQDKSDNNETDEDKKRRLEEEQRRATRRQIQKAIDMKDPEMLERYIQAYEKLNPPYDDEALLKARKTLAALDAKEDDQQLPETTTEQTQEAVDMEEPEILEPDIQEDENPPDNEENNEELRKAREAMKAQKEEEKRRATAREKLQNAIDKKDPEMIKRNMEAYSKLNPPDDDGILLDARKTLDVLDAKEELNKAFEIRELNVMRKAFARAEEVNFDNRLDTQLGLGHKLIVQLEMLEKLRHAVLNLDSKTIAEIKSFPHPPEGVHQTMMATFLLLGNTPKEVAEWRTCQTLMNKTGRESLMRRIKLFETKNCSKDVAQAAKRPIEDYSMLQIRDVSAGAAAFFGWAKGMIEDIESTIEMGSVIISKPPKKQEQKQQGKEPKEKKPKAGKKKKKKK